jgi:starvation-inducible DNA-binding protein
MTLIPNIGLPDATRGAIIARLNTLLADEYLAYTRARNFHWHVSGPFFAPLHAFFQAEYEALDLMVDDIAERVRTLGGHAFGTLAEFARNARLTEGPGDTPSASKMLELLLADHEAIVRSLRPDVRFCAESGDDGTADFLTALIEAHEKRAWMIRAQLA